MSAGPEEIALALRRLHAGGLVAFPTETVYGLGADARSEPAVRRVFDLKGRPATNPLIVHVSGEPMARAIASSWPREASRLAEAFWPGPLSIIVPRGPGIPDIVTAHGPTMAVRCPSHPITLALLEAFGGPLVGPSANPSGRTSPTTADHVRHAFSDDQVYVLDGGPCSGGIESTVVAVTPGEPPRVLRPGLITPDAIARALGLPGVETVVRSAHASESLESPGQLFIHYAPRTPAFLFSADQWPAVEHASTQAPIVVVTHAARFLPRGRVLAMPADAAGYAARLYAALREADALNAFALYVENPATTADPLWPAVMDRLTRATTPLA